LADGCGQGACTCGSGPECNEGERCVAGHCTCSFLTCFDGCCAGDHCIPYGAQTEAECSGQIVEACIACPPGAACTSFGCDCNGRLACGADGVGVGADHSCATNGQLLVRCWGDDSSGQLGLDAAPDAGTSQAGPATVPFFVDLVGVSQLTGGDAFTCAIAEGSVVCWGDAPNGSFAMPEFVTPALGTATGLSAGAAHVCIIADNGLSCLGDNSSGQLAPYVGDAGWYTDATSVAGLPTDVSQVAAGRSHTCALMPDGGVLCWGKFDAAASTVYDAPLPTAVPGLGAVRTIAAGAGITCAAAPGTVTCFGTSTQTYAVDAVALGVGSGFACAVLGDAGVTCWGDDTHGQLGGSDAGLAALAISCGRAHCCIVAADHQVYCWGEGAHFKLGNTSTADQTVPVHVAD
jgi:alpha-tubulin suppressor-like RCC1 family protein